MEERLCKAASVGDVSTMHQVLSEDRLIMDKILSGSFKPNPLHVAISRNQANFVKELLIINKDLASVLESGRSPLHVAISRNQVEIVKVLLSSNPDLAKILESGLSPLHVAISRNQVEIVKELLSSNPDLAEILESDRSPLHVAAAKGNVDIARALVEASRKMCFTRDLHGMNPVHVAAMEGKDEVLEELLWECPQAARVMLDRNETILHLCVKHEQLGTLWLLLKMGVVSEMVNAKDSYGNTILHTAVSGQNVEIVQLVVKYGQLGDNFDDKRQKLDLDAVNAQGHTALDMALFLGKVGFKYYLLKMDCKRAEDLRKKKWIRKNETLMVVTSLIATMAFQAVVSPPSGVWQDDSNGHRAGEAVMAYKYPSIYILFILSNTISFMVSISALFWSLASNLRSENRRSKWFLVLVTWLIITSIAITYGFSIQVITPKDDWEHRSKNIVWAIIMCCGSLAFNFVFQTFKLIKETQDRHKRRNELLFVGYGYDIPEDSTNHDNRSQHQEIEMAQV